MIINISTLSCLIYSCFEDGLMLGTSAPYTTYGDDHKNFNLELSKLQLFWRRTNSRVVESSALYTADDNKHRDFNLLFSKLHAVALTKDALETSYISQINNR